MWTEPGCRCLSIVSVGVKVLCRWDTRSRCSKVEDGKWKMEDGEGSRATYVGSDKLYAATNLTIAAIPVQAANNLAARGVTTIYHS